MIKLFLINSVFLFYFFLIFPTRYSSFDVCKCVEKAVFGLILDVFQKKKAKMSQDEGINYISKGMEVARYGVN